MRRSFAKLTLLIFFALVCSPHEAFAQPDLNPTLFPGSDLGAKVLSTVASSACTYGCTISIPIGSYSLTTSVAISTASVKIQGNGATITGTSLSSNVPMMILSGKYDQVSGLNFVLGGATYGLILNGQGEKAINNQFGGSGGIYVEVNGSPTDVLVAHNEFDGTQGCDASNGIGVFNSAHFIISDNTFTNTCGFGIQVLASNHGTIHNNTFNQSLQQQSLTSSSGQTSFTFAWPSAVPTIQRVWVQINGVPTSTGVTVTYTDALHTTVVLPSAPSTGATVTALGWTALENIQVNSQSWDMTITGNVMRGTGDSGIDVVSDYHLFSEGSGTATQNQSVFTIAASSLCSSFTPVAAVPVVTMNGRILAADLAKISPPSGMNYTVTLSTPQPQYTIVTLACLQLNQPASVQADYPGSVTISGNVVKEAAAAGIAPEISAHNIVIEGNVIEDCGMGVNTPAYSTGIFTGSAVPIAVKNNTIINTRVTPTMNSGISVQAAAAETGAIEKPVLISGNTYLGTFNYGGLFIPALTTRQSGIDVSDGSTIPYPEQPNFDQPWSVSPPSTHYFTYSCSGTGMTRDTTNVIGGVASGQINSGRYCSVAPTNQIFFANSIMQVTFWAKKVSGTPAVELYSNLAGTSVPVTVLVASTYWRQYSIYMPTSGLDLNAGALDLHIDGTSGVMNIQNIAFSAKPFVTGSTMATGASSSVISDSYADAATIGVYQLGPVSAPSGSCAPNGAWVLSQDGHATFCASGTWTTKI